MKISAAGIEGPFLWMADPLGRRGICGVCVMRSSSSIAPALPDHRDVYLVLDDFGGG
jgi:hypothetical protein